MTLHAVLFYILAALTAVSAIGVVVTQNIVRAATWLLFALAGTAGVFFLLGADFIGATQLLIYVGGTLVLVVFGVMLTAQGPFIQMRIGVAEWVIAVAVGLTLYGVLALSLLQSVPTVKPEDRVKAREQLTEQIDKALEEAEKTGKAPSVKSLREAALLLVSRDQMPRQDVAALIRQEQRRWLQEGEGEKKPATRLPLDEAVGLDLPPSKALGATLLGDRGNTAEANLTGTTYSRQRSRMAYLLPFEIVSVHLLVVLIGAAYLARAKRRMKAEG